THLPPSNSVLGGQPAGPGVTLDPPPVSPPVGGGSCPSPLGGGSAGGGESVPGGGAFLPCGAAPGEDLQLNFPSKVPHSNAAFAGAKHSTSRQSEATTNETQIRRMKPGPRELMDIMA